MHTLHGVTMGDTVVTNDALAAAVAAAAEIAKNGGSFLFNTPSIAAVHAEAPSALSLMFPATRHFLEQPHLLHPQPPSLDESCTHESDDDDDNDEEDAERRMARSRERNREHARRTRLRKKAQLEALQGKVKGLQAENRVLKQSLEECNIASILVGLSDSDNQNSSQGIQSMLQEAITNPEENGKIVNLIGNKRRRFVSDASDNKPAQPLKINIDGQTTLIGGGRTHINWKSGVYSDESGAQRQLTQDQLESLRRERNRMHAKMTRDRKKSFIATIEKTIEDLESSNRRMKAVLLKVTQTHFKPASAPGSPESASSVVSTDEIPALHSEGQQQEQEPPAKKVRHGFTFIP